MKILMCLLLMFTAFLTGFVTGLFFGGRPKGKGAVITEIHKVTETLDDDIRNFLNYDGTLQA